MAEKDYAEIMLDAISTVIDKKIETLAFDKTIKAIVVDAARAAEGVYTVSTGTAKFIAYSTEIAYKVNDTVMVTIPQGDYDNQKMIIGKWVDDNNTPLIYKSPFQRIVNVTNNIITGEVQVATLRANAATLYAMDSGYNYPSEVQVCEVTNLGENAYTQNLTRIGLSFQISTWLKEYDTILGNYGVRLAITFKKGDQATIQNLYFDSEEFFGNIYNFETYYTQECLFDISNYKDFYIDTVALYLYEKDNFINIENKDIYNDIESVAAVAPNIFLKDPYICFGLDAETFERDQATLVTLDGYEYHKNLIKNEETTISDRDTNNKKIIYLRWIYKNIEQDTIKTMQPDEIPADYEIRWYRYKLGEPSPDEFAGAHWKKIELTENHLSLEFQPDVNLPTEQLKVAILQIIGEDEGHPIYNLVTTSNILTLINNDEVRNQATIIDLNALAIRFEDDEKGNYFLYNRAGEVGKEEDKEIRWLQAVFDPNQSNLNEKAALVAAECSKITWQIPWADNSMIVPGIIPDGVNNSDWEDYELTVTPVGKNSSDKLYYEITDKKLSKVPFFIKKNLIRGSSNNTVKLIVEKDGQEYTAQVTMSFGTAGTSGSDYTLFVEWENNENAVVYNKEDSIKGYVHLMDSSGQLVNLTDTGATLSVKWKQYWNGINSTNLQNKKADSNYYWEIKDDYNDNKLTSSDIEIYSGNYWITTTDISNNNKQYFNLETGKFDDTNGNKKIAFGTTESTKNAIDFKPIDKVLVEGSGGTLSKDSNNKVSYVYSADKKAFVKYKDVYILDPFTQYDESLTYYYPVNVQEYAAEGGTKAGLEIIDNIENYSFIISHEGDIGGDSLHILEVRLSNFGNYDLVAYYPIPTKYDDNSNNYKIKGLKGPTFVRYSTAGEVDYDRNPFELVVSGSSVSGKWKLIASDTSDTAANILPRLIENGVEYSVKSLDSSLPDNPYLMPVGTYYKEAPLYGVQFVQLTENQDGNTYSEQVLFTQPILVYQDNYPSTTLNKWGGKDIEINNDHGTIVANGLAAGRKEADNSFTGVVIGDWSRTDIDATMSKNTGIYGFNKGAMSYALKDDGTAFFGKDGRGRIYFDGNSAQIYSSNWIDWKSAPSIIHNGMFLDIDDGKLLIEKKNDVQIKLQSDSPFFNIKKYDNNKETYKDLINIGDREYYLQSVNYNTESEQEAGAGIKFDLASGKLEGYNFTIKGTKSNVEVTTEYNWVEIENRGWERRSKTTEPQSQSIIISSEDNYYPLQIGSKFKVSWEGELTSEGGIFNSLEANGLYAYNLQARSGKLTSVNATSGTFNSITVEGTSSFSGTIYATGGEFNGPVDVKDNLTAKTITIKDGDTTYGSLGYVESNIGDSSNQSAGIGINYNDTAILKITGSNVGMSFNTGNYITIQQGTVSIGAQNNGGSAGSGNIYLNGNVYFKDSAGNNASSATFDAGSHIKIESLTIKDSNGDDWGTFGYVKSSTNSGSETSGVGIIDASKKSAFKMTSSNLGFSLNTGSSYSHSINMTDTAGITIASNKAINLSGNVTFGGSVNFDSFSATSISASSIDLSDGQLVINYDDFNIYDNYLSEYSTWGDGRFRTLSSYITAVLQSYGLI